MADISVQKTSGGGLTWVWAAAAIVAIGALMIWLFSTTPVTTEVVTGPDSVADSAAAPAAAGAETVELSAIGSTPDQFVGRPVRVEEASIASVLGARGFWAEVPGANPVLVVLGPAVADASWVAPEATVTMEGTVQPVTETELASWVADQVIQPDAEAQAAFATHYLLVSQAAP